VADTVVVIYLGGWMLATLGAYAASRRWNDRQSPAPHPLWVSVLAGAVWPLLLVGIAELSSFIVYTKVQSISRRGRVPQFGVENQSRNRPLELVRVIDGPAQWRRRLSRIRSAAETTP
jgi:hypothetical protein